MDAEQRRRRVKAARALAGLTTKELANKLNEPGLSVGNLEALEGPSAHRAFRKGELQAIARACDLPDEFFTVESWEALALDADRLEDHERRLRRIEQEIFKEGIDPS